MSDDTWHNAALALKLLAIDPAGLGGVVVRMRASPARDALLDEFKPSFRLRKLPIGISDEQLFGGIDLSATLSMSQIIETKGFFSTPSIAVIPMAERCPTQLAAKIAALMDQGLTRSFVALDEGIEEDECVPEVLADRLAFHIAPTGRAPSVPAGTLPKGNPVERSEALEQLTALAAQFGISSLRAPTLAMRATLAHATLMKRDHLTEQDVAVAATLVYPHRATMVPEPKLHDSDDTPPPPNSDTLDENACDPDIDFPDTEMLIATVKSLLPPGLLNGLVPAGTTRQAGGAGAGQKRTSNRRGRPLPSRPGHLDGTTRIDLIGTLRAAAPWQPLRHHQQPNREGLLFRPSDIRLKRYQEQSDRLLIFCVDASGSAAVSRLGESKGAIELLLAEAYSSRDQVALISFRGETAEVLLPPTRSLVQTKRRLSALPGGGGTPLAAGLQSALLLAIQSRAKGMTPTVVLITDGRANIALDGSPNRAQAAVDAEQVAQGLCASGVASLVIDMSNRPHSALNALSDVLGAPYIPLPRADARKLSGAVNAALDC